MRGICTILATRQRNVALTYDGALYKRLRDKEKFLRGVITILATRQRNVALTYETRRSFFEGDMLALFKSTEIRAS